MQITFRTFKWYTSVPQTTNINFNKEVIIALLIIIAEDTDNFCNANCFTTTHNYFRKELSSSQGKVLQNLFSFMSSSVKDDSQKCAKWPQNIGENIVHKLVTLQRYLMAGHWTKNNR